MQAQINAILWFGMLRPILSQMYTFGHGSIKNPKDENYSINNVQGGWRLGCLAVTKVNFNEHLDFNELLNIAREDAVLYL